MSTCHFDREIWQWCIDRDLWISAAHIPGKLNVEADLKSRQNRSETQWMLSNTLLTDALPPEIDLFDY